MKTAQKLSFKNYNFPEATKTKKNSSKGLTGHNEPGFYTQDIFHDLFPKAKQNLDISTIVQTKRAKTND